jgi:predicted methyltransferase
MKAFVFLLCTTLVACATAHKSQQVAPQQIVAATDRTPRDRDMDSHRKPMQMLAFFGTSPGMRVGEVGAGGGYSTELFARSVGPSGAVFAQDTPNWDGPGLQKAWERRLSGPAMKNTVHFVREWDEPFPPEVKDLDAVYSVAVYHDAVAEKGDTGKMNAAIFKALKPGGAYFVVDNNARQGSGRADCEKLHRIDEQVVRDEVAKEGFRVAGEDSFLRNDKDPRDWNADSGVNKTHDQDRFAIKFVKPKP